jgi:hypothetical protein
LHNIVNYHAQLATTQFVTSKFGRLATRTALLTAMTGEDRRLPGVDDIKN